MVLDNLGDSLKNSLKKIAKAVFVNEEFLDGLLKDIQRALIQADVDVELVYKLTKELKEKVRKQEGKGFDVKERIVKIVYDTLVEFLGGEGYKIDLKKKPLKILLVGLFGSGKTSSAGKLALFFKKKGLKTAVLALDTYRAAAYEQLEQIAKKVGVPFLGIKGEKNPSKVVKKFKDDFKKYHVIIGDSAGRDALDKELVKEVKGINKEFDPDETLLVISGDIGQSAKDQAIAFNDALRITGLIVTKMDGTARGGGALTACTTTKSPVKFIGTGEFPEDLEAFDPKRFVSRLLGMGDLESLLEKAKESIDEDKAKDMGRKFLKGDITLLDVFDQLEAVKKMGSFSKVLGMIPGISNMKIPGHALEVQQENVEKFKYIMNSMTKKELEDPSILNSTRVQRIARGSGTQVEDVRLLIKQYNMIKKLSKGFGGRKMKSMMKQFGIKESDFKDMM